MSNVQGEELSKRNPGFFQSIHISRKAIINRDLLTWVFILKANAQRLYYKIIVAYQQKHSSKLKISILALEFGPVGTGLLPIMAYTG